MESNHRGFCHLVYAKTITMFPTLSLSSFMPGREAKVRPRRAMTSKGGGNSNLKISQPPDLDSSAPAGFGSHNATAAGGGFSFTRTTAAVSRAELKPSRWMTRHIRRSSASRLLCVSHHSEPHWMGSNTAQLELPSDAHHPCVVPAASRMKRMHPMSQSFRCCWPISTMERLVESD